MTKPAVLGIIGGGQLGRMTALAAAALGYRSHVFAPSGESPGCDVAYAATRADYDDLDAIRSFGEAVDAVTCEFENVPAAMLEALSRHTPVSPGVRALTIAQHRISEKTLAKDLGLAVPDFAAISSISEAKAARQKISGAAIMKTCRFGYDGKNQIHLDQSNDDNAAAAAFLELGGGAAILEEKIAFIAEASFLVARNRTGEIAHFPAAINHHIGGILSRSTAPADTAILPPPLCHEGQDMAARLAEDLGLVGLLAVEVFITEGGLIFNEIAPRPHNSFHWTIEGAKTSQFSQLVRCVMGLPLGATDAMGAMGGAIWQMDNILGEDMPRLDAALHEDGVFVHHYGKTEAKTGRKMGHLNRRIISK